MSIATLQDIILKTRYLTGTATSLQLTDAQIIDFINSFYLYDFPAQFRSLKLEDKYTFNTIRGIDTYPFDNEHYTSIQMPCYVAKREVKLFQDPWSFYGVNFNWQTQENAAQGNGSAGAYTFTCQATPVIRSTYNNPMVRTPTTPTTPYPALPTFQQANYGRVQNILITVNVGFGQTLHVSDDGNGNLIGDVDPGSALLNTIDYETGAVSVVFGNSSGPVLIPQGENIVIQYNPMTMSIPLSILLFQNSFVLRPVPDKGYTVELVAYRMPSQALLGSTDPNNPTLAGVPEQREWWETIAVGAAKKIYENRLDSDGIALMDKMLAERYALNESRTYAQLGKQQMGSIHRDQLSYNYGSGGIGFGGGN